MKIIADFHIHSKYSRAVSKFMVPKAIVQLTKELIRWHQLFWVLD